LGRNPAAGQLAKRQGWSVIVFFVEVFALPVFSFGQGQQSRALHPEQGPPWWEMLRATWFTPQEARSVIQAAAEGYSARS